MLGLLSLASASAFATVSVSVSGTYSSAAFTGTYSAPNVAWSLTFNVDNLPATFTTTGTEFRTNYANPIFKLNGTTIPVTGTTVIFSSLYSFNIFLDANTQFIATSGSPQLFSGTTTNPTMVIGSYAIPQIQAAYNKVGGGFNFAASDANNNLVIAAAFVPLTPAPSSVGLMLLGLGAVVLLALWKKYSSHTAQELR
jgi:hypothetical protein